jgi:hypothetical protein
VPFLPSVFPPPKRWAGPTGRGFWVLTLPGVPGDRTGFNSPTAGCSLGFRPPRVCRTEPCPSLHPGSSHTLSRPRSQGPTPPASRSIDQLSPWPSPLLPASGTAGPDNPYRVLAPVRAWTRKRAAAWAMCSPRTASCITADPPVLLKQQPFYRSCPVYALPGTSLGLGVSALPCL